jgi:hypothetical protein
VWPFSSLLAACCTALVHLCMPADGQVSTWAVVGERPGSVLHHHALGLRLLTAVLQHRVSYHVLGCGCSLVYFSTVCHIMYWAVVVHLCTSAAQVVCLCLLPRSPPCMHRPSPPCKNWIAAAAACITFSLLYVTDPCPSIFGFHEVFHALVVAAAACHFAGTYSVVKAAARTVGGAALACGLGGGNAAAGAAAAAAAACV